jgi:hypothetical protein
MKEHQHSLDYYQTTDSDPTYQINSIDHQLQSSVNSDSQLTLLIPNEYSKHDEHLSSSYKDNDNEEDTGVLALTMQLLKLSTRITSNLSELPTLETELFNFYLTIPPEFSIGNAIGPNWSLIYFHILFNFNVISIKDNNFQTNALSTDHQTLVNQMTESCEVIVRLVTILYESQSLFKVSTFIHHCIYKCCNVLLGLRVTAGVDVLVKSLEVLGGVYHQAGVERHSVQQIFQSL